MTNKPVPVYTVSQVEMDLNGIWMDTYNRVIASHIRLIDSDDPDEHGNAWRMMDEIKSAQLCADAAVRAMLGHRVRGIMDEYANQLEPETETH